MAGEMETFFQILIYGDASWFFLLMFMGIGFLIAWKVRAFSLVCMVACLYQAIAYGNQNPNLPYIYNIILLLVGMCMFGFRLAGVDWFD